VAIDGVSVVGKTVLADELVAPLERRGRPVIRASIDGFHNPRTVRHRLGPDSPKGYLRDSFNDEALRSVLLDPLGPGGNRTYRAAVFDFRADAVVESPVRTADPGAVLLFDGIFLLRPALAAHWDVTVFVEASFETTLSRALVRDIPLFGSAEAVRERYAVRYIPGETLYLERERPRERADVVVLNDDPADATLEWRTDAHERDGVSRTGGTR